MKLKKDVIEAEHKDSEGYWIDLKPGYCANEDPVARLHTIYEDTKREA